MKVDVIQASECNFGKLSWWSNWIDIAVVNHSSVALLVQMKVSRTNAKKFKCTAIAPEAIGGRIGVHCSDIGDLMPMKKEQQ